MKRSPVLATLALAALLLAGCSGGDSSESAPAATSGGAAAPNGVADTEAADAGKGGAGQAVSPPAGGSQAVSPAQAVERLSVLAIVGGTLFQLVTGVMNIQYDYAFGFSFYTGHFYSRRLGYAA